MQIKNHQLETLLITCHLGLLTKPFYLELSLAYFLHII